MTTEYADVIGYSCLAGVFGESVRSDASKQRYWRPPTFNILLLLFIEVFCRGLQLLDFNLVLFLLCGHLVSFSRPQSFRGGCLGALIAERPVKVGPKHSTETA
jgi:hypothetical protein